MTLRRQVTEMQGPIGMLEENAELRRRLHAVERQLQDALSSRPLENDKVVSELRYRRLFEAAQDGILIVDLETRKIIDANPFMIALLGYPLADLVGMEVFQLGLFTEAQARQTMLETLIASGQVRYENLPLQTADGVTRDVEVVANRYEEDFRTVIQFNIRDVTRRRKVEAESRAHQHFLGRIIDVLPGVLYIYDLDENRTVYVNNTFEGSYSSDEIAQMGPDAAQRLMHPDDQPRFKDHLAGVRRLKPGETASLEYRMKDKSENWRWYMSTDTVFLRDENGGARQAIGVALDITQRKHGELALAESENRFRFALAGSPITVFEQDPDLRYTWICNPALGHDAGFVLGKTDADLMDGAVAPHLISLKKRVLATGQSASQEVTVAAPGQDPSHFHLTVRPRRNAEGRIEGILSTAYDITERKRADAALQESEHRYRTAIETTSAVTWSCPPSGFQDKPQPSWQAFTGLSATETLGDGWLRAVHPDDAGAATARWTDAVSRNVPFNSEHRIRRHDGAWRWMRVQAVPIHRDGVILEWFGMCVDISARKHAEAALRDSETRLKGILNQSPAGIVQTDADGRIVFFNSRWCEMLGYSEPEMRGMNVVDLTHPTSVAATLAAVDRLAKGGPDFQIEKNYRRKDGVMVRCSSNVSALRDADGTYRGLLAVVLDMTERLDAEDRLRESDRQQKLLLVLSDRLRTARDVTTAVSVAAELFARHCGLPLAQYLIIDPDGDQFHALGRYSDGWLPAALPDTGRLSDHGPFGVPQGGAEFFDDPAHLPDARADALTAFGIHSGSAVPLWRDGRLVALFTTASPEPRRWTEVEKALQHEVAERTWAAVERARAEDRLQIAHDTFRNLIDRSPFGTYLVDADFRMIQISEGAIKGFHGVKPLIGRDFSEVIHAIWPEEVAQDIVSRFRHTLATGDPHKAQLIERRAEVDATEAYDWKIERVILPDGRPGVVCHFYDFSEKQRQEEHIKLLMGEVNHRAKNMLSLVQAIARRTVTTQPEDFIARFGQRISALSAGQDLLVKSEWRAVQLAELVRSQLAHFGDDHEARITISGPPVKITAAGSQTLGLALHELATNAAKYGSLSNAIGRVNIGWHLQPGDAGQTQFVMSWIESGGPTVVPPTRRGFGSTIIDGMLRMSLGCDAHIDFHPTGLVWGLSCAADGLIESAAVPMGRSNGDHAAATASLGTGRRILVVEDDPLIAMDFAQTLSDAGYVVVGPANSVSQALALLGQIGCDAAVVDTNLGTETSEPVARELLRRGTPFVATSGYSREQQPLILQSAPLLGKPVGPEMLVAEIARCLDQAQGVTPGR